MGIFRTIAGACVGLVGAAVATASAPVTLAAIATGAVISNAVGSANDDDIKNAAQKEGHKIVYRKGWNDAAKHFVALIEHNEDFRIGSFAVALYVAQLDGEICDEELEVIVDNLGSPNSSYLSAYARSKMSEIVDDIPTDFIVDVLEPYISCLSTEEVDTLDEFIKEIISSDNNIAPEEKVFYECEWKPVVEVRNGND